MNILLFDDPILRTELFPFTLTRPAGDIRIGILTIAEKWGKRLNAPASFLTEAYLSEKFVTHTDQVNLFINGSLCPDQMLTNTIASLNAGEGLLKDGRLLVAKSDHATLPRLDNLKVIEYEEEITLIDKVWKIFQYNASQLRSDFELMTSGKKSVGIKDKHTIVYNGQDVFVAEGAQVKAAILNAENGPIYLGKNAQVMEGALIRGPFALCEGSTVNMGAKVRGDTTVGPYSKIGGEVSNTVIFGYSNKAHDGFLGNSVIGEWCNIGADTNTSNLKNNYENIKIWNYARGGFEDTGLQFCGLMMGDHSKCGINTMFNTGTVVGVGANIFGDGFPRTFIPSFAWGGAGGFTTFQLDKALETAAKAMQRRSAMLTEAEKSILKHIFEVTAANRVWEKK
jgi:UDP-N-acetylglucosamine diphosphorylase/glucosamine-1-phosphate N-acetyltransferase